eukprot:TRINITY_DN11125_c0_g1_i4.p1 TRINITY_DN11125_c0_g1~~TRINITY_DN11125_c0_g1_i4.p1  ORF type:complete len:104 (+),score=16.04 TRINITY_DN11125_c0_g1_i4:94-405(+)
MIWVNRDLAARNVLVNDQDVAKVADFGLAKQSQLGDIDSSKLPIKWTAPEVLKHKVSTAKSDGQQSDKSTRRFASLGACCLQCGALASPCGKSTRLGARLTRR